MGILVGMNGPYRLLILIVWCKKFLQEKLCQMKIWYQSVLVHFHPFDKSFFRFKILFKQAKNSILNMCRYSYTSSHNKKQFMFLASFRVGTVLENLAMLTTQRKHGNDFLSLYRTSWKMNFSKKKRSWKSLEYCSTQI